MNAWLVVIVWAVAASALHLRGRRRLERAARARHEIRGPLCTAQLALDGLERSARVEAIGMELRRAALALDDLAVVGGPRTPSSLVRRLPAAGRPLHRGSSPRIDVARLLADAEPVWRSLATAHGATLAVDPGRAFVAGDPLRLAQACANLVANAVEHGGGSVRVTSWTADSRVRIEVADDGPGLPAPPADLLAAARGRRSPRGHGLAITAAIAEHHGGRLVEVPARRGAHLALDLPEAPATSQPSRRTSSPATEPPRSSPAAPRSFP